MNDAMANPDGTTDYDQFDKLVSYIYMYRHYICSGTTEMRDTDCILNACVHYQ